MSEAVKGLTLLRKFVLLGSLITLIFAAGMASLLERQLRAIELTEAAQHAGFEVTNTVVPLLEPRDLERPISGARYLGLKKQLERNLPDEVVRFKLWAPDGTVLFSDDPGVVGQRFAASSQLARALSGEVVSHIEEMGANHENAGEGTYEHLLEVYVPLRVPWSGGVEGAFEIYEETGGLDERLAATRLLVWLGSFLGFLTLFASLFLLIARASRRLAQQNEEIAHANRRLSEAYEATIEGLARALDKRDEETEGHSRRVMELTERLLTRLGLPPDDIVHGRRGALLHDIGKMGIPDAILLKPGPLDSGEWEIMRTHPSLALEMLRPIEHLREALHVPHCHHEKWDGSGYPRGLRGEEIPLVARAFALADVWDALGSPRAYREAWPQERVMEYIRSQAGKHFDPALVPVFCETMAEYIRHEGRPNTHSGVKADSQEIVALRSGVKSSPASLLSSAAPGD